jgi:hypothetical protein
MGAAPLVDGTRLANIVSGAAATILPSALPDG